MPTVIGLVNWACPVCRNRVCWGARSRPLRRLGMSARWLAPVIALTALVGSADWVRAENDDLKFEFSTDPKAPKEDEKFGDLFVRPNTARAYYLFLRNKSKDMRDVVVQIMAAD